MAACRVENAKMVSAVEEIASIAGEVEDAFGVEISDAEAADVVTVGDFLRLAVPDAK